MASIDPHDDSHAGLRRNRVKSPRTTHRATPWTLALIDAGIAAALIVAPFLMGGRTPAGQFGFACIAFWTCLWWAVHQTLGNGDRTWRTTLAFWPMVMALGLVLFQLAPLSPTLLQKVSPHLYEILPLWKPGAEGQATLGTWRTLSMTPDATSQSLRLLLSGVLLFAVTVQRIQRISDVERIIRWLAISVSLMAAFGIVQFLASNGKFFWTFEHPYSRTDDCVKGAFTNRNHFAHFIALGFGAVLWWVYGSKPGQEGRSSSRNSFGAARTDASFEDALKILLLPTCALATLMSFSRGGVLALLVSSTAALFLLRNAGKLTHRTFAVLTGSGLVVCLGLSIYGYDVLSNRFAGAASLGSLDNRSRLWAAASDGFGDHLLSGTGLSSHRFVCPMYLKPAGNDHTHLFYTHAENGYVQTALETGVVGLVLALAVMGFYFFWCAATLRNESDHRTALCFVAVVPALLANAVHSTTDYVWYVPGCMGVLAILGACACRLYQLQRQAAGITSPARPLPRFAWAGIAVALIAVSASSLPGLWQTYQADAPWNRYLLLKRSLAELNRNTPYADVPAQSDARKQILADMLQELSSVLNERPEWALAHASKADVHRDLFHEFQSTAENAFDLRMIRETVLDNFDSVEDAKEWLPRGVGEHYVHLDEALQHAHHAAQLGPLQGEAYLILAELAFLEDSEVPARSAYVDQAFRVRPYDGWVLFEIGSEMTLAGRPDLAMEYFKRSFRQGREHQRRLVQVLAGSVPVQEFLREFNPDADAMQLLLTHYTHAGLVDELDAVLAAHAAACESKAQSDENANAAMYWVYAARSYGKLHNTARRRDCLQHAVAADSTNFGNRLALAQACIEVKDFAEAEKQANWCVQRKPDHPPAKRLLDRAVEKRIATANQSGPTNRAGIPSAKTWR